MWVTTIRAICPVTGEMKSYGGPNVPGITHMDAQKYCNQNIGYCKVEGELIAEISCKEGTYEPDFGKMIDYENTGMN